MRVCSKCGETRLAEFYATSTWCKRCHKNAVNEARLRSKGLTLADHAQLMAQQGNACAVCKRSAVLFARSLHVDHSHATGAARGLLCGRCNQVLGRCDDDPALLRALAAYIDKSMS